MERDDSSPGEWFNGVPFRNAVATSTIRRHTDLLKLTSQAVPYIRFNNCMKELEDTKSRILKWREESFGEHGFDQVSIRDNTGKTRVSRAADFHAA